MSVARPVRVGIVGANPHRGWAHDAHIPALRALPGFDITALSTTRQESADASAQAFGIEHAFADHNDLVAHPDVDLVVVTVKVEHHLEIASAALRAGKSVYSEWPLGRNVGEARALVELAAHHGSRTLVGLQGRFSPQVMHARDLIAEGYVGEVLSTTLVGTGAVGGTTDQGNAYQLDKANSAGLLKLVAAHSLDLVDQVLGRFTELSARLDTRRPDVQVVETGERLRRTSADQVAVIGRLESGTTATMHFREGIEGGEGFLWEINGTAGTLQLRAASGHPGMFPVTLTGSRGRDSLAEIAVPARYDQQTPGIDSLLGTPAHNIARLYNAFATDLATGTRVAPGFDQALAAQATVAVIEEAASSGARIAL